MKLFEIAKQKPMFTMVIGGAGSGKNYFIENNPKLKRTKCIDVDEIKKHVSLDTAIKQVKIDLEAAFKKGEDVVHPTTGSNLKGQQNKIALAKEYGYAITLILKDTPLEQALKNVKKRAEGGGHDVLEKDIVASNEKARANYKELSPLADTSKIL
jgi:predicted kinase